MTERERDLGREVDRLHRVLSALIVDMYTFLGDARTGQLLEALDQDAEESRDDD